MACLPSLLYPLDNTRHVVTAGPTREDTGNLWHPRGRGRQATVGLEDGMAARIPATMVVMDDEPSLVRGLAQRLRLDGHTVETAAPDRHARPYGLLKPEGGGEREAV